MNHHTKLDTDRLLSAVQADENIGFCRSCGAEYDGAEPDARGLECQSCGKHSVYGAEELLMVLGF